jgi:hypothetical protein
MLSRHDARDSSGLSAVAIEDEIYLNFVTTVIAPLKKAVESREAGQTEALSATRKMKELIASFEASLRIDGKEVKETLTASEPNSNEPPGEDGPSPLERWLSTAGGLAPRQRSIAREIEILRVFDEAKGVVVLKQLQNRLQALGLSEAGGQAAVVTQISRLKKVDAIRAEAQGLYSRTDGGTEKLQGMRRIYGPLFVPEDARKSVL